MHKVPVTRIVEIFPHPNPKVERLEIAKIYDFNVVTRKGQYKTGDSVLFIPPDSVLTQEVEDKLFPPNVPLKIRPIKHRIRQIRIQQFASQGMICNPEEILPSRTKIKDEEDYAELLGILKYEPPLREGTPRNLTPRNKSYENPYLHKFGGIENIKWYPNVFQEGEAVVIQEKLHGTNARYSLSPTVANTLWKKVIKLFGLLPEYEFCFGSNNVQLQGKNYTGFYEENVYSKIAKQENIESKLVEGYTIYGEIIGSGIQKNYTYGCKDGEHHFVVFDIKKLNKEKNESTWLTPEEVKNFCWFYKFKMVPTLYEGPFNKELAYSLTKGNSVYCPEQKVREGVVVKSAVDLSSPILSKKMLKIISEAYLDEDNTDFH